MKAMLWRLEGDLTPKLVECSTDKWKDGLQPYLDSDENLVRIGQSHFETYDDAVQFVILNKNRDIEALALEQAVAKDKVDLLSKAIAEAQIRLTEFKNVTRKND